MLATIGSAIGLFAATNIDDIVVLTVLFLASSRGKPRPWQIVAGQYLGFITLVVISVIAALGLTIVPDEWVGFLGLIPLGIGIWTLVRGLRRNGDDDAGRLIGTHKAVTETLERVEHWLVPVVFIGLGLFILIDSGVIVRLVEVLA